MRGVDFRASLHCGVGDPRFHLVYFPTRGLAEVSRLVLAEAALPYTYECASVPTCGRRSSRRSSHRQAAGARQL